MKQDMSSGPAEKAQTTDANAVVLEIVTEMSPSGMTEVGPSTRYWAEANPRVAALAPAPWRGLDKDSVEEVEASRA